MVGVGTTGGDDLQVSARDLHSFLEVGKVFDSWIKDRIESTGFVEDEDYKVIPEIGNNPQGGRPTKEYWLTLDTAKELSMLGRNDQGKRARRYFIACEKRLRSLASTPTS